MLTQYGKWWRGILGSSTKIGWLGANNVSHWQGMNVSTSSNVVVTEVQRSPEVQYSWQEDDISDRPMLHLVRAYGWECGRHIAKVVSQCMMHQESLLSGRLFLLGAQKAISSSSMRKSTITRLDWWFQMYTTPIVLYIHFDDDLRVLDATNTSLAGVGTNVFFVGKRFTNCGLQRCVSSLCSVPKSYL